ncbi:Calcium-binding protein CML10 [Actinidia chinensis var. chinensis]|uniref:Calcium-binding protein CML10 n=1 Tax=Actinidia chinensis var. chinensis TaxID=1590841 RepID=A0A2R6RN59_ACTCC|nr:Calcium-binding protein CML10 [Actinidia chinensis var. chinensis]
MTQIHIGIRRPVRKSFNVPLAEDQLKAIFKKHDKNGDGRLCRKEVRGAFEELGACFPEWRAWRGLCNADANGDGFITEDELNGLVKYTMQLGYTIS